MLYNNNSSTAVISVSRLSKRYRIYPNPIDRILDSLPWKKNIYRDFWAVQDISFQLPHGKTLGIIGKNGSGKSTLLQLVAGTLHQTHGYCEVNGRIGALLELGSGFNPEFTGYENIYTYAAVLGITNKKLKSILQSIIDFADIGDFIDQPIKHYSSGMVVRLAFAVQAHINPSVLIVDEALAVGDELFQKKCFARLEYLKTQGTSIVLVSHSSAQINQHCDQAILLHKGRHRIAGDPHTVTAVYQRLLNATDEEWDNVLTNEFSHMTKPLTLNSFYRKKENINSVEKSNKSKTLKLPIHDAGLKSLSTIRYEPKGIEIASIQTTAVNGDKCNVFRYGSCFTIVILLDPDCDLEKVKIATFIADTNGNRIGGACYPEQANSGVNMRKGTQFEVKFEIDGVLWPGTYFIGAGVSQVDSAGLFLHRIIDALAIRVVADSPITSVGNVKIGCRKQINQSI